MSNPLSQIGSREAAALELTLAVIANTNQFSPAGSGKSSSVLGANAGDYVNAVFNKILANLNEKVK